MCWKGLQLLTKRLACPFKSIWHLQIQNCQLWSYLVLESWWRLESCCSTSLHKPHQTDHVRSSWWVWVSSSEFPTDPSCCKTIQLFVASRSAKPTMLCTYKRIQVNFFLAFFFFFFVFFTNFSLKLDTGKSLKHSTYRLPSILHCNVLYRCTRQTINLLTKLTIHFHLNITIQ